MLSNYFTQDEYEKILYAFIAQGCHDASMEPISPGPRRQDQQFYHSGTIRISCNQVSKDYQIETSNSTRMDTILQDIHDGVFNRSY